MASVPGHHRAGSPACGARRSSAPSRASAVATGPGSTAGTTGSPTPDTSAALRGNAAPARSARQNVGLAAVGRAPGGSPAEPDDLATAALSAGSDSAASADPAGREPTAGARAAYHTETARSHPAASARCHAPGGLLRASGRRVAAAHRPGRARAAADGRAADHAGPADRCRPTRAQASAG